MKRLALLASFGILVGLSLFQTDALSQAESFRVSAERRSRQAEERGLAEAYKGITRDGTPEKGLFSIRKTGVSTEPVRLAAEKFLAALSPEERAKATFPVEDPEWRKWMNQHFYQPQGINLHDLNDAQREAGLDLLRTALSAKGFKLTRDIMRLNHTLGELNNNNFEEYGEWRYAISIFGQPSACRSASIFMWSSVRPTATTTEKIYCDNTTKNTPIAIRRSKSMMSVKFIALCFLAPAVAFAQADSGRPGTVFFVEGAVFLKDVPVKIDPVRPTEVRNEQRLRTEQGNAEMLFALGSFIRLGANSEIEMVDAGLTSATVRLHRGAMIIEAFRTWGGDSLKVLAGDYQIAVTDAGEMRIAVPEGGQPSVEVLSGGLLASALGQDYRVKKKQSATLGVNVQTAKIKALTADALTTWHEQRVKTVLAETPKGKRRGGASDVYGAGERPFGLGDLPDRTQAGVGP